MKTFTKLFVAAFSILLLGTTVAKAQCAASFTWMQTANNTASFTSTSTGTTAGTAYIWSFGDGNYAYAQNTQHLYANSGYYNVCLTIFDSLTACQSSSCDSIFVTTTGILSHEKNSHWDISPNPAINTINLNTGISLQGKEFFITDITGRRLIGGMMEGNSIDISTLNAGIYILQIKNEDGGFTAQRFIKN
jgi:PKD repeat protein